jgi:hypothetical protein
MSQLAFHVVGHASKRGLIPRQPPADRVLADIETWLRREYPDVVRSTRTRTLSGGDRELLVGLHPAAQEASIRAADSGRIEIDATLRPVGPGYQTFVARLIQRIGTEHEIAWGVDDATVDPTNLPTQTDLIAAGERPTAERAYLAWLGTGLITARDARRRGSGGIHLGTPPDVRFTFEGAIATSMGPRDDAWLERAIADSRLAVEVTPWWPDATDARWLLNRAVCLMWTDVRWRLPADETERAVHEEVLRLLARAFPLDPSLPYPWREWKELADLRGAVDAMTRQVDGRALRAERGPLIGYRRQPVRISHEGWGLEVPGSFAERRTDDEWWGGDGGRTITIAATETGTPDGPMSAHVFLQQVAPDLGHDALIHQAGPIMGRARLSTDGTSGIEIGVLEGYSAVVGKGAAIRIEFDDSADWRWALDVWRALAPADDGALAPV